MKSVRPFVITCLLTASAGQAMLVQEKFATDPASDGWRVFGNTNLFHWNPTNRKLDVTWDSTQTNSYFYHPLGAIFTTNDSFCVLFDLQLNDATAFGYGMELAVGLQHYSDATTTNFNRANSPLPNLFEFDYFPDDQYGDAASIDATLKDAQAGYQGMYWIYDNLPLNPGKTYRVVLIHRSGETTISGILYTNGQVFATLPASYQSGTNGNFQLDTLSVSSYADDGYGDSILAHGTVGNLAFASPLPVDKIKTSAAGRIQFASDTNWLYTLEQTADFRMWTAAAPATFGNGTNLLLQATNSPAVKSYYRVRADLP